MERCHRLILHTAFIGLLGIGLNLQPKNLKTFTPLITSAVSDKNSSAHKLMMEGYLLSPVIMDTQVFKSKESPLEPKAPVKRVYTPEDTLIALRNASPLVRCAVYYEVGLGSIKYPPWDPNAVSYAGSIGPGQLHPKGKLVEFYRLGYDNPYNPYQVIPYMEYAFQRGQQFHWDPVRFGMCG